MNVEQVFNKKIRIFKLFKAMSSHENDGAKRVQVAGRSNPASKRSNGGKKNRITIL